MISKIVEQQLKKVSWANLNNYNKETGIYYIPRYTKPSYQVGSCYIIKIPAELVNNKNSLLATNYNNNLAPKYQYLKIYISKTLGTLIYVDSIGVDPVTKQDINDIWSGWLDAKDLEQITIL